MFHSVADVWVFGNHESLGLVWTLPGWKLNTNKQTHCPGSTFWLPAGVILPHYCLLWCGKLYCSTPKDQKRQANPIPPHDNATTFAHATSLCTSPSFKVNTNSSLPVVGGWITGIEKSGKHTCRVNEPVETQNSKAFSWLLAIVDPSNSAAGRRKQRNTKSSSLLSRGQR